MPARITDARSGKRINALVQGDVGCGKTIVAFLMMTAFVDSGYQAVLMAPTQVLARQHYEDLKDLVEPMGYKVVFLGGTEMKAKEKKSVLAAIANGDADYIVGTHAVIAKDVTYNRLAITVTDEEHKFGVAQRAALVEAAAGVHNITMSATPIPRTLAQAVYGNAVQLYTIKTMPQGRKPVITGVATDEKKIFRFIINQAKQGHQTYVVCPMIDPNDDMSDVKSVDEVSRYYERIISPYGVRIAVLTGRNSKEETEEIICGFKNHEFDVLITTTVIEVGVNVPSATVMVVSNAERCRGTVRKNVQRRRQPGENETMVGGNEPSANVQMTGDTSAAQSADVSVPEDSAAESTAQKGKRKDEDDSPQRFYRGQALNKRGRAHASYWLTPEVLDALDVRSFYEKRAGRLGEKSEIVEAALREYLKEELEGDLDVLITPR